MKNLQEHFKTLGLKPNTLPSGSGHYMIVYRTPHGKFAQFSRCIVKDSGKCLRYEFGLDPQGNKKRCKDEPLEGYTCTDNKTPLQIAAEVGIVGFWCVPLNQIQTKPANKKQTIH